MQRRWARALLPAAVLLAGLAAPAAPASAADAKALEPVRVALQGLPGAVELAILEAEDRLLSSEAQHRLAVLHAYVQGFQALPAGSAALADPATRAAYTWTEDAVETALGLPQQLDAFEEAGALCRSYGNAGTPEQVGRALRQGPLAEATLRVLQSELAALAARAPAGIDRTPFDRTRALLEGYLAAEGTDVHACLETLHAPDPSQSADLPDLFAVVIPPDTFRTGHVRVVGTVRGAGDVSASSSTLAASGRAAVENGTFRIPLDIPRGAALGGHTVTVAAGSLRAAANLTVGKAEVSLSVQAPSRVVANTTFTAFASVSSPAGTALVDAVPVHLSWRGNGSSVALHNATGRRPLDSGAPDPRVLLDASFAGNDVLATANATLAVEVYQPGAVVAAQHAPFGVPLAWFWWLLVLIAAVGGAILLYLMPVILHRARGSRGQALRGTPSPPRWPGAATFVAAVAALFDLLRRRRLAPPGQTLREWLDAHGGPAVIADRFDAVRYGGAPEDEQLRKTGLSWAEKAWARWRERQP